MENNLVLVVHGIGEQAEGETLDALVGGVVADLPILEKVNSRRVLVAETQAPDQQIALFPVHIRETVVKFDASTKFKQDQQITAAEVYWSDLSPAPRGALATVVDLFRVVLGLGYLALDNIENNGFRHPMIARSVRMFVWVFYTLIAPMNVVLLLGALALLADPYLGEITDGRPNVTANPAAQINYCYVLGTLGIFIFSSAALWSLLVGEKPVSYLARNFMKGYGVFGMLITILALVLGFGPSDLLTGYLSTSAFAELDIPLAPEQAAIAAVVSMFMYVLGACFLLGILVLLAMTLMSVGIAMKAIIRKTFQYITLEIKPLKAADAMKRSARDGIGDKRLIYLAICTAMMLLWMLISTAFWAAFAQIASGWKSKGEPILLSKTFDAFLGQATSSFSYALLVFLLVMLAAGAVAGFRSFHKNKLAQSQQVGWQDVWLGRLILNPVINILLVMGMGLIVIGTLYVISLPVGQNTLMLNLPIIGQGASVLAKMLSGWAPVHEWLINMLSWGLPAAAFAAVLIYNFASFFAAALGVGRDIVIYSTRSHAANPRLKAHSTYLHRVRIEDRFTSVLAHMTRNQTYDRVIVVAHSQGTVVAAQGMQHVRKLPTKYEPMLLTMGSPLNHIYAHYFSDGFSTDEMVTEKTWINIYRRDDFVGTRVTRNIQPVQNHTVAAKGHTNYWTDQNVLQHLKGLIGS